MQLGSRVVSVQMHTRDAFEAIEDRSLGSREKWKAELK